MANCYLWEQPQSRFGWRCWSSLQVSCVASQDDSGLMLCLGRWGQEPSGLQPWPGVQRRGTIPAADPDVAPSFSKSSLSEQRVQPNKAKPFQCLGVSKKGWECWDGAGLHSWRPHPSFLGWEWIVLAVVPSPSLTFHWFLTSFLILSCSFYPSRSCSQTITGLNWFHLGFQHLHPSSG